MFFRIKNAILKKGKRIAAVLMSVFTAVSVFAVGAFAADSTEGGSNMAEIISSAGSTLQAEFLSLVKTLGPILITIAIAGLGMFAIIYLFKVAKKLFTNAAS